MASAKEALVQTLRDSASQIDHARVRDATTRLEEWRTVTGFFSTLQDIFLDSNIPEDIRFQGILYLKNHIDRYWRKTAKSAITEDEKSHIRTHLIHALQNHFPRPWIATNAYIIGRIARHDFPRFWPDLVTQLLDTVRQAFEIESQTQEQWRIENGLIGLGAVVKELASVKLGMAVAAFQQITPEIFRFLGQMYQHMTSQWIDQLPALSPNMAISAKILGIMRNLLVYGYDRSGEKNETQGFFDLAVQHLRDFYQFYNSIHGPSQEQVLRHISKLTKLFSAYAAARPFEFLIMHSAPTVISALVQICQHEARGFNKPAEETDQMKLAVLSKVVINAVSTVRSVLRAISDPKTMETEQGKNRGDQVMVAKNMLDTIFNGTSVLELAALLWGNFLILRHCDLEAWEEDPEGWILEVTGDVVSADSEFRTAGEALFMELVINYKDEMIKFLAGCIQSLQHPDMMTPEQVIYREAVYNAITLNSLALYDLIDFDEWLVSVIPAELSYSGPHTKIIRRRMALLISEWVGTKCSEASRRKVYETLLSLLTPLDPRNDAAIRLSAASAFRCAVDEWNFKVDDFLPYLDAVLIGTPEEHDKGGILGLMGCVQHIEARMKLLSVVDDIVERCDRKVIPYVPSIMNLLPYLWDQSEETKFFRASVLSSLKNLIGALGERSVDYHAFIVRLICLGTDPSLQEEFLYLFEDALYLWEEAVKNAPTEIKDQEPLTGPEYNLMGLFPKTIECLQLGSESLKSVLRIIEYYIILDPVGIMQRYAVKLFAGLTALTVDLKPEAHRMVMNVVELAIQGCPLDLYFATFVESGLFFKILAAVIDDNENMIVTSQNMNILARLAIQNPDLLLHYLRTMDNSPDIVSRFVDKWAGPKFDSIGQPKSRKLNAMGLTALLRTNDKDVLNNLGAIINVWFNVVSDVKDNEGGDALIYWRNGEEEDTTESGGDYAPSANDRRTRLFLQNDPVHTTNLMTYMKEHLALAQTTVGGPEVFREVCLRNVDDALVDQMNTMFL